MIPTLIRLALSQRWLVLMLAGGLVALGVWAFQNQQIDAYPDISGQMVQIITTYPGRAPEEVERQVTIPLEIVMRSVPRVEKIRSRTIFGLSIVEVLFEEGVENYWARQRVKEKLDEATLPDGVKPDLGALATAYGEIYRYELVSDGTQDLMDLRTLQDWVVTPRILRCAGVADVENFGGYLKQYTVTFNPAQLDRYNLSLSDVTDAIQSNNTSAGGSVLSRGSMSFVIRGKGSVQDTAEIGAIFIRSIEGSPVYLRDVAAVGLDYPPPTGIFSKDRRDESIEGIVLMRRGENPSEVLGRVKEAVEELNATILPRGVRVNTFYDRTFLVQNTLHTVAHSVALGITLVVLVLLLFLGRPSMAALVALTIPFALLVALLLMYLTRIPIGLLSVGAIDFGIIVDGAVIMAENIAHRLGGAARQQTRQNVHKTVLAAALEVERPVFFSVLMIIGAYLPLLSLTSIEGLLFRPMALTLVFALLGALFFALFVVPVLATILFRRGYQEWDNPLLRWFRPVYAASLRGMLHIRWLVVVAVAGLLAVVFVRVLPRLGTEFLPYMDEGVLWIRANFPEGTSIQQTTRFGKDIRQIILDFPEIQCATVQAGRNDSGTDPFPPSRMELMVAPKPSETWQRFRSKHELVAALGQRLREEFPTTRFNFTQPIIDSVTEDTNGTSANLAVEFSGPQTGVLLGLARKMVDLLRKVPGAQDVSIEQEGPQPQLVIDPDRALCARHNVRIDDVKRLIDTALGGEPVGALYEGDRRFDIVAKLDRSFVTSAQAIGRLPVHTTDGTAVPLAEVARIEIVDGQTIIARENGVRRMTVRCDITGRDQGGFVAEAQRRFAETMTVPAGYRVEWLGMFENLTRARRHFMVLIPITIALIFVMLWVTFHSPRAAVVVLLAVPFACIGGVLALYVRGMHLNMSSAVGFTALFGVAIMDGVLMVRWISTLRVQGMGLEEAIVEGALERLRPILMTSIVAIFGLLPASLATGLGSDVQRPLATVIVWGLFSSTTLTLFVVPVFYRILVPRLPKSETTAATSQAEARLLVEPLPDVPTTEVVSLLEHLHGRGGQQDVFHICDETNREFARVIAVVKAAEMLGFIETPGQMVVLEPKGKRFAEGSPEERKVLWREQLLTLRLFRDVYELIQSNPEHVIDRDFILETIVTRMPYENYERMFNTFIRWARFGDLFKYDETVQRISLGPQASKQ
jgi:cobalt-zinc-cadmium resistance protein CzcA